MSATYRPITTGCRSRTQHQRQWLGSITRAVSALHNDLHLTVAGTVPNQHRLSCYGQARAGVFFGDGYRCVSTGATGLFRIGPPALSDAIGNVDQHNDLTQGPPAAGEGAVIAGSRWFFRYWYRGTGPSLNHFNLSNCLDIRFVP
ncbi:MAG: hypothetical protein ACI841_001210 [Planctomycetota bacterium]|jgi:hypothetical protein